MKAIVYNLSQHYYEAQSNIPTGKVSMNKIRENAHSCVAFCECTVIEETETYSFELSIHAITCLSIFIFGLSIEMFA